MSNITLCIYKDKTLSEILDEIKEYLNISVEYFENTLLLISNVQIISWA